MMKRLSTLILCRQMATKVDARSKARLDQAGPSLADFVAASSATSPSTSSHDHWDSPPYLQASKDMTSLKKVYFEVYGCQMNVSDVEIARGILLENGYAETKDLLKADVALLMTCAIREKAETRIWGRIAQLKAARAAQRRMQPFKEKMKIGLLGCMAERLRASILEKDRGVDLVAGPDAYRDLPRLLRSTVDEDAINVMLSADETYADIAPVREDLESKTAYVSIMRGCDNFCTFCIVPYTRGRERSRPVDSILSEVRRLSDQGVREVTLLGQNVNSYRDLSESSSLPRPVREAVADLPAGFRTVYKPKMGGRRFSDLLDAVSLVDPEMRIRFTSPHPKDFPDEVLSLIKSRPNICQQLLLPAQSGSDRMLAAMNRGYTRAAYLNLIDRVRDILPDVALISDFISGFCGETEEDHQDSLSLIRRVGYSSCFCFSYSLREKTKAHRRLVDDVPTEVKHRRTSELLNEQRVQRRKWNDSLLGSTQLILVTGDARRSDRQLVGRCDSAQKVHIPKEPVQSSDGSTRIPGPGDYVAVKIDSATSQTVSGTPLCFSSIADFHDHISSTTAPR